MMSFDRLKKTWGVLLPLVLLFSMSGVSHAIDIKLRAAPATVTMPDKTTVTVWGFAQYSTATMPTPTIPGPVIKAAPGETVNITLKNDLPAGVNVSLVVPGQATTMAPVNDPPGTPGVTPLSRVRSFNAEVAPGSEVVNYLSFTARAGTYRYESGTNPATQIPMGLYGALVVGPGASGQAYPLPGSTTITTPQVSYDRDEVVLFSEILARYDKTLKAYVTYNSDVAAAPTAPPSTLDYAPLYFLINGKAFPDTTDIVAKPGQKTLLRLINVSGSNRMPTIQGNYLNLIAEDGNLYNYLKSELAPLLPSGKTLDAMLDLTGVTVPNYYALYDRRLGVTNAGSFPGGMITFLSSWDPAVQNCSPFKGDVNGDGVVNVLDVLVVLQAIINNQPLPAADVFTAPPAIPVASGLPCGDGVLDLNDALWILKKAVGLNPY